MSDEVKESAKAIQEASKATHKALEVAEKLGPFFAKCVGEPIEEATGIITDKLRSIRWERQLRFVDRVQELLMKRGHEGKTKVLPPKFVIPIIENASFEDNDDLQDLWARLLSSALDPEFKDEMRASFIDILKQLEIVDVHILAFAYDHYRRLWPIEKQEIFHGEDNFQGIPVTKHMVTRSLGLSEKAYKTSVDNLIRVRCVSSLIEELKLNDSETSYIDGFPDKVTFDHGYEQVCLTSLGSSFINACINIHPNDIQTKQK